MKRRDFFAVTAGATGLAFGCKEQPIPESAAAAKPTPVPFVLGCQSGPTSDEAAKPTRG